MSITGVTQNILNNFFQEIENESKQIINFWIKKYLERYNELMQ
jgi:hypothetical protein